MSTDINENVIAEKWQRLHGSKKLEHIFEQKVLLKKDKMKCFKDSYKSSIWKLHVDVDGQSRPFILKIFKNMESNRAESIIELNMYRKAKRFLQDFIPRIYFMESEVVRDDIWVFMEHVQQLDGQVTYTPYHFDKIIPTLAKLHGHTHNHRFYQEYELFDEWLPLYHSNAKIKERNENNLKTLHYLDAAMNRPDLFAKLSPSYNMLGKILLKGHNYFPEVIEAGQSIVHNDLQTLNIACNNVKEKDWDIKFLDWEGAKFDPCWFDMINLCGVFLSYREDWKRDEDHIIHRCAHLYANEMQKYGIIFKLDPVQLYKMSFLQMILEKNLYLQLHWEVEGIKKGWLLPGYLEKINAWGKELGLH